MALVGQFLDQRRNTHRAPVNPMDKCTVFNMLPQLIEIKNPTLQPGVWEINPGSMDNPSRLVVGPSSWWRDFDPEQPLLEIPVGAALIADSLVNDYIQGMFCCDMGEKRPGLFWVLGDVTVVDLKVKHKAIYDQAVVRQKNWYAELIKKSDIQWARTNGNPLSISDHARVAAKEQQIERAWAGEAAKMDLTPCPACGNLRNAAFPVCTSCKTIIDMVKFKALGLEMSK